MGNKIQKKDKNIFSIDKVVNAVSFFIVLIIIIFIIFNIIKSEINKSSKDNKSQVKNNLKINKEGNQYNNMTEEDKEYFMEEEDFLISATEYKEKIDSGEYINIDIRTPEEHDNEKISEGLNINFYQSDFKQQLEKLDKDKEYLYYCRSGHRSSIAKMLFKELGFKKVYELKGGIISWKYSGLKTI